MPLQSGAICYGNPTRLIPHEGGTARQKPDANQRTMGSGSLHLRNIHHVITYPYTYSQKVAKGVYARRASDWSDSRSDHKKVTQGVANKDI